MVEEDLPAIAVERVMHEHQDDGRTDPPPVHAAENAGQLAEVDLELRGEGDVLGDAQSGVRSSLRLLRVVKDADLIALARQEAERILNEDPALMRHEGLAKAIERRLDIAERAALAKT